MELFLKYSWRIGENIPNDNLVEICVHVIKKKMREQGANLTYESAKKIASCVQMQEEIRVSVQQQLGMKTSGQTKPSVDKKNFNFNIFNLLSMNLELMPYSATFLGENILHFKILRTPFHALIWSISING